MNNFYSNLNIRSIQPDYILSRQLLELLTNLTSPILDGDLIRLAGGTSVVVVVGVILSASGGRGGTTALLNHRLALVEEPLGFLPCCLEV